MAQPKRRRSPVVWLVAAALLIAAGAWLMRGAEPPDHDRPAPVNLPTSMTNSESQRADTRRTWVAPPVLAADAGLAPRAPEAPKDPVLAMMPAEVKRGAVVAEFNAIMNSELGGKLTECLFGDGENQNFLDELRDAGLDPTTNIDRVAMVDDSVVISGDFKNAQWKRFLPGEPVTKDYGRNGQLHEISREDGGTTTFATWGGQMFIGGRNEADIKSMLDRLDGTGPQTQPVLNDSMAYGDVYGVVNSEPIADMMQKSDPQLADLIRQSARSMQLHMDVGHDVGMVADVDSSNTASNDELRRSLGAALSLARMQAAAKGDNDQADLLDLAKVGRSQGQGFRLEAGLPHDFMVKALDECIAEGRKRRGVVPDGGAPEL